MKCYKGKLYLFLAVLFPLLLLAGATAAVIASGKPDEPQKVAIWTESQPHSMETKTSVAIEGTVHAVKKKTNMLTVKTEGGKKVDLSLDADTRVSVGAESKSLADLVRGMKIKARYSETGGKNVAIQIEAEAKPKKGSKEKK